MSTQKGERDRNRRARFINSFRQNAYHWTGCSSTLWAIQSGMKMGKTKGKKTNAMRQNVYVCGMKNGFAFGKCRKFDFTFELWNSCRHIVNKPKIYCFCSLSRLMYFCRYFVVIISTIRRATKKKHIRTHISLDRRSMNCNSIRNSFLHPNVCARARRTSNI